jgi:cell division protein FtsZ
MVDFDFSTNAETIIKVIGVGGGGGNAVNYMFNQGIKDVTFAVCNTDYQDLRRSPIPIKIQLGDKGLGAGNVPEVAREAALETIDKLEELLDDSTKMVFITAGMGGGTGTGAAPVIAEIAKNKSILTVGIVTIPFEFEGEKKIQKALNGVREMSKHVDALLVINNERLIDIFPDFKMSTAFAKADNILTDAAKGIAEIITIPGYINVDFADVQTILKEGGFAIMNTGFASGEKRVSKAIHDALNSPLLNNNDIKGAKRILLHVYTSKEHELDMTETIEIKHFLNNIAKDAEVIWGATYDEKLEESIKITIIATGFGMEKLNVPKIEEKHTVSLDYDNISGESPVGGSTPTQSPIAGITLTKDDFYSKPTPQPVTTQTIGLDDWDDDVSVQEFESIPAFKRNNLTQQTQPSSAEHSSLFIEKTDDDVVFTQKNKFLHDNVD